MNEEKPFTSGEGKGDGHVPFSVTLIGDVSFVDEAKVYMALDQVYRSMGGSELCINAMEDGVLQKTTSEFDVLAGTEFKTAETEVIPSPFTPNVLRQEVRTALKSLLSHEERQRKVLENLETRFPASVWGNAFPKAHVIQTIMDAKRGEGIDDPE